MNSASGEPESLQQQSGVRFVLRDKNNKLWKKKANKNSLCFVCAHFVVSAIM